MAPPPQMPQQPRPPHRLQQQQEKEGQQRFSVPILTLLPVVEGPDLTREEAFEMSGLRLLEPTSDDIKRFYEWAHSPTAPAFFRAAAGRAPSLSANPPQSSSAPAASSGSGGGGGQSESESGGGGTSLLCHASPRAGDQAYQSTYRPPARGGGGGGSESEGSTDGLDAEFRSYHERHAAAAAAVASRGGSPLRTPPPPPPEQPLLLRAPAPALPAPGIFLLQRLTDADELDLAEMNFSASSRDASAKLAAVEAGRPLQTLRVGEAMQRLSEQAMVLRRRVERRLWLRHHGGGGNSGSGRGDGGRVTGTPSAVEAQAAREAAQGPQPQRDPPPPLPGTFEAETTPGAYFEFACSLFREAAARASAAHAAASRAVAEAAEAKHGGGGGSSGGKEFHRSEANRLDWSLMRALRELSASALHLKGEAAREEKRRLGCAFPQSAAATTSAAAASVATAAAYAAGGGDAKNTPRGGTKASARRNRRRRAAAAPASAPAAAVAAPPTQPAQVKRASAPAASKPVLSQAARDRARIYAFRCRQARRDAAAAAATGITAATGSVAPPEPEPASALAPHEAAGPPRQPRTPPPNHLRSRRHNHHFNPSAATSAA